MVISYKKLWKLLIDRDMKKRPSITYGYKSVYYKQNGQE